MIQMHIHGILKFRATRREEQIRMKQFIFVVLVDMGEGPGQVF